MNPKIFPELHKNVHIDKNKKFAKEHKFWIEIFPTNMLLMQFRTKNLLQFFSTDFEFPNHNSDKIIKRFIIRISRI